MWVVFLWNWTDRNKVWLNWIFYLKCSSVFFPELFVSSASSSNLCLSLITGWSPLPAWKICVGPPCPGWTSTAPCLSSDPVSPSRQASVPAVHPGVLIRVFFSFPVSSVVLSSLRLLSTSTAILTDPSLLPEQAALAVTQGDPPAATDHSSQPVPRQ